MVADVPVCSDTDRLDRRPLDDPCAEYNASGDLDGRASIDSQNSADGLFDVG